MRPLASFVPTASIDLGALGAFVAASSRLGTHPDLAPVVFVGATAPTLLCGLWSLTFVAALRAVARPLCSSATIETDREHVLVFRTLAAIN